MYAVSLVLRPDLDDVSRYQQMLSKMEEMEMTESDFDQALEMMAELKI